MRPVICMVTSPDESEAAVVSRIASAARGGTHLIQIRQPALEGRALVRLVAQAVAATQGTAARVLVNDRLDVALGARAHGVHLRGDSMPAPRARAIAPPGFVIGRSVHSAEEAEAADRGGGLDYLLFGTVFPTLSKPGIAAAGIEALADVCARVALPVLAIGGVTRARVAAVAQAGAAGFAAIGMFADPAADGLTRALAEAALLFDTPRSAL
jgi:thiamine-phosphate diphosphorylase